MLTIVVHFHQSQYRHFKAYYPKHVQSQLRAEFPELVSYSRFIQLLPLIVVPLCAYLKACYGDCTGISFIDSTGLPVCENRRIQRHKVFRGIAARGHSSTGWYFGFKLDLVVNDCARF